MDTGQVKIYELDAIAKMLDSKIKAQQNSAETLDINELKSFEEFSDNCIRILDRAPSDSFALTMDVAWVDGFAQCMRHMLGNDNRSAGVILGVGSELARHTQSAHVLKTLGCALYYNREQLLQKSERFLLTCFTDCISRLTSLDPSGLVPLFPQVFEWVVDKAAETKPRMTEEESRSQQRYVITLTTLLNLVYNGGWHTAKGKETGLSENLKCEICSVDFVKALFRCLDVPSNKVKGAAIIFLTHTAALFGTHCIETITALGNVKRQHSISFISFTIISAATIKENGMSFNYLS